MGVFNTSKDLTNFKVNIIYDRSMYEDSSMNIPIIVIYPNIGRDAFENLLIDIQNSLKGIDFKEVGMDIMPRYNTKVNELIYYAQGSGDMKRDMQNHGVIDKYWDKNNGYATINKSIFS